MGKTLKKVLIFFILLCVAALIVLLAEMFIWGDKPVKDVDGEEPPVTSSESETPPTAETPTGTTSSSPPPSETQSETPPTSATPTGTEYKVDMPGGRGKAVSIYIDDTAYEHEEQELGEVFYLRAASGAAKIEIGFALGGAAEDIAPGFLDNYIDDYTEFESSGTTNVGISGLVGWKVFAKNNTTSYEAWLVDSDGCVLLVVIDYRNETQRDILMDALNTLKIS